MNIIKLQDRIMPDGCAQASFFNKHLKGKYAYWVQMRYIVPFDFMSHNAYVACEEDIKKLLKDENGEYPRPYGCEYLDLYSHIVDLYDDRELNILDYIDSNETERINNINEYILNNSYVTDEDITLDELKKFRTWLAKELLLFDTNYETGKHMGNVFDNLEFHVLNYYANGMMDQIISALIDFGNTQFNVNNVSTSTCGCHVGSDLSSLYNSSSSLCDPIGIYKMNIYNKMTSMFSNIDFWMQFPVEFISVMKRYIDNIINTNLPLSSSEYQNPYKDCVCIDVDTQDKNNQILMRLSKSLGFIINNEYAGHRNYIKDALTDWANNLYEQMEW